VLQASWKKTVGYSKVPTVNSGLRPCPGWWRDGADIDPDDVVRRIAAECTFVNERGGFGIRLKPAAAIVRQYGLTL
jgi:hypothetical protein